MNTQVIIILILLTCFLNQQACKGVEIQENRVVQIEECKGGQKISIGDTVIVKLKQYPGRGFSWHLQRYPSKSDGILFINRLVIDDPASLDDSYQIVLFKFLVIANSAFIANFEYQRAWERDKPAFDTCRLILKTE